MKLQSIKDISGSKQSTAENLLGKEYCKKIDYALPQNWLNEVTELLKDQFDYNTIRFSLVSDYNTNGIGCIFIPITIEGSEILKILNTNNTR